MLNALIAILALTAEPAIPQPLMNERGELVVAIDPNGPLPATWHVHAGRWHIVDGALAGLELKEQRHGASITHPIKSQTLVIAYEMKIGPKNRNATIALNSKTNHLCRLVFEPQLISLRKPDLDHGRGPDERIVFGQQQLKLEPDKWYPVLVEVQGDEVLAQVGDDLRLYGRHEVFGREKVEIQLTSGGQDDVGYRNFRIWSGTPKPTWPTIRSKLTESPQG